VLLVATTGCGAAGSPDTSPAPAATRPAPAGTVTVRPSPSSHPAAPGPRRSPRLDTWSVGARPLPVRPDGFGKVLPTPRELRVRRLPTKDLLPPPTGGRFQGTVGPVTPGVRRRMGRTWSPACPVGLADLRHLTLTFQGFDGRPHTGELVVNASVAHGVVAVFRMLYAARFPIEEMRLVSTADLDAPPTGDGNNTAAYVCRTTRGASVLSAHAYGLAIDVNPFLNPYRNGDLVLPELASAYLDRSWRRPGMVLRGGVVTRAFASEGWTWGGDFTSLSDLMHFSANGR
jgi:D-alanyl-D-alanine carboxypeptidase-like protein